LEGIPFKIALWIAQKRAQYGNSNDAAYRLATGSSDRPSTPGPSAIQNAQSSINQISDQIKQAQPALDVLNATATIASLTPVGEAGAATGLARGLLKVVGGNIDNLAAEGALNSEGQAIVNTLSNSPGYSNSFSGGKFLITEATEDITVVRVFGGESGKEGSFFGLTVPSNSKEAEAMYYLKAYKNDASLVSSVTIKKGTQFAIGGVENGTGTQVFIPRDQQNGKVVYSAVSNLLK
jgi:hypothetical protein